MIAIPPDRLSSRSVELVTDRAWLDAFPYPPDWIAGPSELLLSVARSTFRKFSSIEWWLTYIYFSYDCDLSRSLVEPLGRISDRAGMARCISLPTRQDSRSTRSLAIHWTLYLPKIFIHRMMTNLHLFPLWLRSLQILFSRRYIYAILHLSTSA